MKFQNKFIGVLGLGYWGKNIFRNFHEMGIIRTACDLNPEVIEVYKKEFCDIRYTVSMEEVLLDPAVKAVSIATPAITHYEITKKFLLANKDVFVEKPLALTSEEGRELMKLAMKQKRILMVGHILQYHPAIIKLKKLIESDRLGKIQYIYSNRLNIGKLRTEENILWSFAPHDISVILMLLGKEPVEISAFGSDSLGNGVYDTTITNLKFKTGIKGHIFVSWLHPYKDQKLIVVGSKAMAVFDDMSNKKLLLYPHKIKWENGHEPVALKAGHKEIAIANGEPLRLELEHFIECIRKRKMPKTDAQEGVKVLKILEAAERYLSKSDAKISLSNATKSVYVHESSYVDEGVMIGKGTKIWHFSHILNNSKIGKNCVIGQNVSIGPDAMIGNKCKIQNNVSVYKGVILEDEVFCGPSCVFTNVYNPRSFIERKHEFKKTLVKKGATIGANATIVCGVVIGRYAFIGAGAVVKKDVLDHVIVAGVPAKPIGYICVCGTTLNFIDMRSKCTYCGNEYSKDKKGVKTIMQNKQVMRPRS